MAGTPRLSDSATDQSIFVLKSQRGPRWVRIGAILCAFAATFGLLASYLLLRQRHTEQTLVKQRAEESAKAAPIPLAQIYEDEARLKGSEALISGTVQNLSGEKLEQLFVELELTRRTDGTTETRTVSVVPNNLAPHETGRYSLTLPSREWSGSRLVRLGSVGGNNDLAFKSALGERRPLEGAPQGKPKVVIIQRPRSKGEEFLNTPDNPIVIH